MGGHGRCASAARQASIHRVSDLKLHYLPYGALREHRTALARFGTGLKGMLSLAAPLR